MTDKELKKRSEAFDRVMSISAHVYWRKGAKNENLERSAFNALVAQYKASGIPMKNKTQDPNWAKVGAYFFEDSDMRQSDLYYHAADGYHHVWVNHFELSGVKKHGKAGGRGAIAALNDYHKKRTGNTLRKSFGYADKGIRRCVPRNFYWDNFKDYPCGKVYRNISSIDGCSQYPAGFLGKLPTTKDMKIKPGTIPPNAQYPFAFYIKSGHLAIFGEFDTHDWMGSKLWMSAFKMKQYTYNKDEQIPYLDQTEDTTVLMKAADEDMAEDFKHFYKIKESYKHDSEEYITAKLVMNAAIGMMHRNDSGKDYEDKPYRLAHLAAVALARANNSILKMAKEIGYKNILQIMVDGIVYIGPDKGQTTKELGKYHQEITKQDYLAAAHGVYAFRNSAGEITKYKHLGRDIWNDGTPIDERKPQKLEDVYLWQRKKAE